MATHDYVIKSEGGKRYLVIDYRGSDWGPSVADYQQCMLEVIDDLSKTNADMVVLAEVYETVYNEDQTRMLKQIGELFDLFYKESIWAYSHLGLPDCDAEIPSRHNTVVAIAQEMLKVDPIRAYITLLDAVKREQERFSIVQGKEKECSEVYLKTLYFMVSAFERTELVQKSKQMISKLGRMPEGREIYKPLFEVQIKPSFVSSRVFFEMPKELELVDQYVIQDATINIYRHPEKIQYLYYVTPPEYNLSPDKYFLLSKTREVVASYHPEGLRFMDPTEIRNYFMRVYETTVNDLAQKNKIEITSKEISQLARIVTRYTIGYGMMELILSDRRLTDVYMDAPLGSKPIYVVHGDYGACQTNVVFTEEEAKGIISRFRAMSGRPYDEAHPVLDFDMPDLQTRVCVIGPPLSPDGTAFALRLHKETPWTLAQFVDVGMMNPLAAGLLSFLVDAQASTLVNGSRGSGKTSLLQALMLELLPSLRIIVQEDSVTGDSEIIVEKEGKMEKTTAGELTDGLLEKYGYMDIDGKEILPVNPENVKVFSLTKDYKMQLVPVSQFNRHKVSKNIYSVRTASGKEIKVTEDHSLFTLVEEGIAPVKTSSLKEGDYIAIPRTLPFPDKMYGGMNVFDCLETGYVEGEVLRNWLAANKKQVKKAAAEAGYSKCIVRHWIKEGLLPTKIFKKIARGKVPENDLRFKIDKKSKPMPAVVDFDLDFLTFVGLWLADGCYDGKYGTIISVVEEELREVVRKVAHKFGLKARRHSDGFSLIISNTGLNYLMRKVLGMEGNSYSKKLPQWAYNLSKDQKAALLKGIFSGDGCVSKNEIIIALCSKELLSGIIVLLSSFGIVGRLGKQKAKDKTYPLRISGSKMVNSFREIGFLPCGKVERLGLLCAKKPTHDTSDIIPLPKKTKEELARILPAVNKHDYVTRNFDIGREKFGQFAKMLALSGSTQANQFGLLAEAEVFWDEIVSIVPHEKTEAFVYDFSVPNCENFVCENIIAHNTMELPVPFMRKLGFNIQRLKTQSAIAVSRTSAEVAPEEALRTALRLGDSVLVVGEVRSKEALVLYEAMRIGAVGNTVMGTIHGENAYSVWDRIVNDLGVPNTSFKATDMVVTCAPIRFKGSLRKDRRLVEITEVGKHWYEDPEKEGGLLDLLRFDAAKDEHFLEEGNIGKSEFFPRLAKKRGLTMEDFWKDIYARAETKKFLAEQKMKQGIPELLEARYTVPANDKWGLILERQRRDIGFVDYDEAKREWISWVSENQIKPLVGRRLALEKAKKPR